MAFMERGALDEIEIYIIPELLGGGRPLFRRRLQVEPGVGQCQDARPGMRPAALPAFLLIQGLCRLLARSGGRLVVQSGLSA